MSHNPYNSISEIKYKKTKARIQDDNTGVRIDNTIISLPWNEKVSIIINRQSPECLPLNCLVLLFQVTFDEYVGKKNT